MPYPIGLWIDHADLRAWLRDNDYAGLFDVLAQLQPKSVLIMDGLALAVRIKERFPDMVVIHRDYSYHEGDEWQKRTPQNFVSRWVQQGHPEIVRYLTNEPSYGAHNAAAFAKHEADTIKLAYEKGFRCVAFNESIGGFEASWLPLMDVLWHTIVKYDAWIGYHGYMTVSLPQAFAPIEWLSDPVTEGLETRSRLQPHNWITPNLTPRKDAPYWWLLREIWLIKHFMDLGYTQEQLTDIHIETEFGYDNIVGGNSYVDAAISTLRLTYGEQRFNFDMRGLASYQTLHRAYYPEMGFFERIGKEFNWWTNIVDKAFWKHSSLFYAINTDWFDPEAFDISHDEMRPLFPVMYALSRNYREDTEPMPTNRYDDYNVSMAQYMVHTTKDLWNIREEPSVNSDDAGDMPTAPTEATLSKTWVVQDATYDWYKISVNGVQGFTAQIRGESVPNIFVPIVADTPDTGDEEPPTDPDAFIKALEQRVDSLETMLDALTTQITDLLSQFEPERIDFLQSTVEVPRIVREPLGLAIVAIGKLLIPNGYRFADITTNDEIAAKVYVDDETVASSLAELTDSDTVSHVAHDDETVLDTMMNPEAEDSETEEGDSTLPESA